MALRTAVGAVQAATPSCESTHKIKKERTTTLGDRSIVPIYATCDGLLVAPIAISNTY